MPDLEERVRVVLVVFQEVKHTQPQHVKRETYVTGVVEPVQHLDTHTAGEGGGGAYSTLARPHLLMHLSWTMAQYSYLPSQ